MIQGAQQFLWMSLRTRGGIAWFRKPLHVLGWLFAMAFSPIAHGVVGGIVDGNQASSPYAGVGSLTRDGSHVFSAVVVSPRHVLTAAHVVYGTAFAGRFTFHLNVGSDLSFSSPVAEIVVHPRYAGYRPGPDGTVHDDIAVLKLAYPVPPGTPIYPLHAGSIESGQPILFVGYGAGGDRTDRAAIPPRANVKRAGAGAVAVLLPSGPASSDAAVYVFAPGGGSPAPQGFAGLAGGDSGSPAFMQGAGGGLELLGINTFRLQPRAAEPGSFMAGGGGIAVGPHAAWIYAVISETVPSVNPEGWLARHSRIVWLALGAGSIVLALALAVRRHRRGQ